MKGCRQEKGGSQVRGGTGGRRLNTLYCGRARSLVLKDERKSGSRQGMGHCI